MKTKFKNLFFGLLVSLIAISGTLLPTSVTAATNIPLCEIQRTLKIGSSGEDVRCLQRYLNWSGFNVALIGNGSLGSETTYFGNMTANAVTRWQNSNYSLVLTPLGLSNGTGIWGNSSFSAYVNIVINELKK